MDRIEESERRDSAPRWRPNGASTGPQPPAGPRPGLAGAAAAAEDPPAAPGEARYRREDKGRAGERDADEGRDERLQRLVAEAAERGRRMADLESLLGQRDRRIAALTDEIGAARTEAAGARREASRLAASLAAERRRLSGVARLFVSAVGGPAPDAEAAEQIRASGLFDEDHYRTQLAALGIAPDGDAADHFFQTGAVLRVDPCPLFSTEFYLSAYPEVALEEVNPLIHYLTRGARERRDPCPWFMTGYYVKANPDVAEADINPLVHFLHHGGAEGRDPSPWFDSAGYLAQRPDVADAGLNPLVHYVLFGEAEGSWPSPRFDVRWYRETHRALLERSGLGPLAHHTRYGAEAGLATRPEAPSRDADRPLADTRVPMSSRGEPQETLITWLTEETEGEEGRRIIEHMVEFKTPFFPSDARPAPPTEEELAIWVPELRRHAAALPATGETPDVSIVMPVYNGLRYTLSALTSLLRHETRYRYEVCIGDNQSDDDTNAVLENLGVPAIKYVRHPENFGFIGNANTTADLATGRHLVFLNNDTVILPGWLDNLIAVLDDNPDIGLAGSKLLFPDGRLQECGGIIWRDGSGWNFGRGDDPRKPEYSYVRDVDYCSGAAIAVPRALWHQLGGFDGDYYVFSYCDDSDIAFRIRQRGLRTVVQPLSALIHIEGGTMGTDVTTGDKAYQVTNAKKFYERFKDVLADHRPSGAHPELEKERAVARRALVIDHVTPTPNEDAGSITCLEIMRALQAEGYKVTFIPETNFCYLPHTRPLQAMGIEAIYGPTYTSVRQYLEVWGHLFDVVMVFREPIASRTLEDVKALAPQAKVLFHTTDLHYLREQRAAAIVEDPAEKETMAAQAVLTRKRELAAINRADLTIVHSETEHALLARDAPEAAVYTFPWILDAVGSAAPFEQRAGLAFVGGYQHTPNVDAVLSFVEDDWPRVRAALPEVTFHVIGSRAPAAITDLAGNDGIVVHGFVEDLAAALAKVRMTIAPLRYGAGIKGKIAVSLAHGVPVVGTEVAAEGMGLADGETILLGEPDGSLAEAIVRLHGDADLWVRLSQNGLAFVEETYGRAVGARRMREILTTAGAPVGGNGSLAAAAIEATGVAVP